MMSCGCTVAAASADGLLALLYRSRVDQAMAIAATATIPTSMMILRMTYHLCLWCFRRCPLAEVRGVVCEVGYRPTLPNCAIAVRHSRLLCGGCRRSCDRFQAARWGGKGHHR